MATASTSANVASTLERTHPNWIPAFSVACDPGREEPSPSALASTVTDSEIRENRRVHVEPPAIRISYDINVKVLHRWQGRVIARDGDEITAILEDETDRSADDEEIVFSAQELSEDDRPLAVPGAVFYMAISYEDGRGRPRRRVTTVRFRRLPNWSGREVQKAKDAAQHVKSLFQVAT